MATGLRLKPPKMSLKDFQLYQNANSPTLQDFVQPIDQTAPVSNVPSNQNTAAYAAALNPAGQGGQALIDNYQQALAESNTSGQSTVATTAIADAQRQAMQANVNPLMDVLSNPNVDDATKRKAVESVYDQTHNMYSPVNMLSTKGLGTALDSPENEEVNNTRYDMGAITQELNQNKAKIQAVYNSATSASDPSLQQHMFDFGMNLVPFARQYMMAKIRADESGAPVSAFIKTFLGGVGTSTDALRDHIASLPVDQQLDAAQSMANIINTHSNVLISTPNDEFRRQTLQNILGGQGYSGKQELADNLASWLDLAMLGGAAVKGGKAAYGLASDVNSAVKASAGLNDSKAFFQTFEENYAKEKAAQQAGTADGATLQQNGGVPTPPYEKVNKNSLGQFQRSRETLFYDSSTGIPYKKMPAETVLSSSIRDAIRSQVQPVSVFQNLKDVNVDMARDAFGSIEVDASEQAARALAGTSRADALASAMMPEVAHVDGSVSAKVAQVDGLSQLQNLQPAEIRDFFNTDGYTQYSQAEKAATRAWKVNDFQSAAGVTPRGEMFQYIPDMSRTTDTPQGFKFVGVYGPMNSGFGDPQAALDSVRFALRNQGIDESAATLLRRDGDRYIPSTLEEAQAAPQKDFLVSVDHDYHFNSRDVDTAIDSDGARAWQPLKVKMNFFDRVLTSSGRQGTLASHLVDKGSQLDKVAYYPSLVGVDKAAGIEKSWLKQVGSFAKSWKSLSKDTQRTLLDEIQDANLNSRPYDYAHLTARGIPQEGLDVMRQLQNLNDGIWFTKNQYYAQQLDKAGYEEFVHVGSNTNLPARAMRPTRNSSNPPTKALQVTKVYNPVTDTVDQISKADIQNLYQSNGQLMHLRQPVVTQGGDVAEHVISREVPTDSYSRKFTPQSKVLNYRPGYYGVQYKEPFHIIERVPDATGKVAYEHSVATAKDTASAKHMADRLSATAPQSVLADGKPSHYFRKAVEHDPDQAINSEFDVEQAHGMASFRRRGKLLEDSTSNVTNLANAHVANPVEVLVKQVRSLSDKVIMQDVIDAQARRAIYQWGDFLPKDRFGNPVIPTDLREIKYRGGVNQNPSAVADARTSFGYINYLQHGYTNSLNDLQKALFHNVADLIGKVKGPAKVEQATRAIGEHSLTNGLKSTSYYAYMGTSPAHQIVLQGQQAAMLAAINPKWLASVKAFSQPSYLTLRTLGMDSSHSVAQALAKTAWGSSQAAEDAYKQFVRTGLGAAVDHQNMVSGAVNDMAQNMISNSRQDLVSKGLTVPRAVAGTLRKVGFDAGEFYSSAMSWLAHRDLAEKQGLNVLDADVADMVHGSSRNFTGAMNRAGALPQDKNALAFLFQYTSNQQKMLLNMITNRNISWQTKATLATLTTILYGTHQWHVFDDKVNSIQDPQAKEILRTGLEGWGLNKLLSYAFGGKSEIDWSSLSPVNAYGFMESLHQMITGNFGSAIANAPSTSLLFGNNPRIANAYKDALAYVKLRDDYQDTTNLLQVAKDFANISSGYSSAMKAKYLVELHKKVSTSGRVSDDDLDSVNAVGVALGFPTLREGQLYDMQKMALDNKKQTEADFNEWYRLANLHYADSNLGGSDLEHAQRMLNEFYRAYGGDNPYLNELMDKKLKQDVQDGHSAIYSAILRNCQLFNKGDCINLINAAPFTNEQDRKDLIDIVTFGNQFKPDPYDGKKD